jgi:hypothetical protein
VLNRSPAKFVGRPVTTDALTYGGLVSRMGGFELDVALASGKAPSGLRVVVPKDLGLQLNDLGLPPGESYAVRLSGAVKPPAAPGDPRHLVEVAEVGFLSDAGEPTVTLKPATEPPPGEPDLGAVNRFPARFVGRRLTLEAVFKGVGSVRQLHEVRVANENDAAPLNLEFFTSKDLAVRAEDELPRGNLLARLTCTVERVAPRTGVGLVSVSRVEVLHPQTGEVVKTLSANEPVKLPSEHTPPSGPAVAPKPPPLPKPPDAPPPEDRRNWALVGGAVIGGVAVLAVAAVGVVLVLVFRGGPKPRRGRRAEPDRRPADPRTPDTFPGFGE